MIRDPADEPSIPRRTAILFGIALALGGCAGAAGRSEGSCPAGAPYLGPDLRPPPAASDLPAHAIAMDRALPRAVAARLDRAFRAGVSATEATAAAAAVVRLQGGDGALPEAWSAAIGTDGGPEDFWWASAGKLVTAAVILQLSGEGALSMGTTIERWFPDFPRADRITIDHLLTHTSGAFTFDNDARQRGNRGYLPPGDLVAIAARHGLDFCPGMDWSYSNTGYVMLAMIAERVEDRPFAEIVRTRVAEPLGAFSLRVIGPRTPAASVVAPRGAPGGTIPTFATIGGAGPVVGTPMDMIRLLDGWFGGTLVPSRQRDAALAHLFPVFASTASYGRGIMVIDVPGQTPQTRWFGHLGGSPVSVRSHCAEGCFQGMSSPRRVILWSGMRARVSASQASGSTPHSLAVSIRV